MRVLKAFRMITTEHNEVVFVLDAAGLKHAKAVVEDQGYGKSKGHEIPYAESGFNSQDEAFTILFAYDLEY